MYGFAGLSFITTIVVGVRIFDRNSRYLEQVIREGRQGSDSLLDRLDVVVFLLFVLGVVLTGGIAITSGITKLSSGATP
jgi:hypothetical protein